MLKNPAQKIKGGLVRHVERKYYKRELIDILDNQKRYIPELNDRDLYDRCINELYGCNDAYGKSISKKDFSYLFVDDIMFYQRPLKSKKSLIAECPYEYHIYKDKAEGEEKKSYVKCMVKSHPLFQEFRIWQFIQNLRIYQNGTGDEVTDKLLPAVEDRVRLFDFLNDRKDINQSVLFNSFFKLKKLKDKTWPYRWNYVEDKSYPCNRTRAMILSGLMKAGVEASFLDSDKELRLWHILYSVADRQELGKAIGKFALEHGLDGSFVDVFSRMPLFDEKDYGSYSAKAIKKLLPLMRMGRYWSASAIDKNTLERIDKIINGECDENIRNRVREKTMSLSSLDDFQGLPLWLACYVVYDRHSEATEFLRWTTPDDIDRWLAKFRQHSLRNPVVEQVIMETMRTVRDIWKRYGKIDEIHIEMGRDLKNPADKRKQMTERITENENTNLRIKAMLAEFINPEYGIDDVRPYSPSQQDLLRIYEEGALAKAGPDDKDFDFLMKVSKNARPSKSDIMRYKLWLDQKYCSPYTGRVIPLAKLFTPAYEIEHIIPQSRYFDDSFSNKVICESEVNKLKDNKLAYEFIKENQGQKVPLSMGGTAVILSISEYERNVNDCYKRNRAKLNKLLMDDIPDSFIERQMNDSRYISKYIKNLLSNIVREEGEVEAISKNVVTCTGSVTDRLKKDWAVNDVWNRVILPRFQRLNELTGTDKFTSVSANGHLIPDMPLELQKGFNKKRIDHRHHAMDAIVIACTTRSHVNLLSNEAALSGNNANRYQLSRKLRRYETVSYLKNGEKKQRDVPREFLKPWSTFTADVEKTIRSMIVSFKQNLRVINKTTNKYQVIENGKKTFKHQTKGDSWAIRKQMHKDTVYGEGCM